MLRKKSRKKRRFRLVLMVFLVLAVIFIEMRLKPVTAAVAEIQAQALATEIINQSVYDILEETGVTSEELETITFSSGNSVTSVSANSVLTNKLKNAATLRIQESLSGITNRRIDIPLGTILGGELLSGLGPSIPVFISLSGTVKSDFESSFESGGFNQTVHRLSLRIYADITIVMPLNSVSTSVETSVLISETIISGSVPSSMLYRNTEH